MNKSDAGKGDDPRNLGPKFRENYDSIDWRKLRSSEDWHKTLYPTTLIFDPDGWNRSDFDNSWKELITKEEFLERFLRSTIMLSVPDERTLRDCKSRFPYKPKTGFFGLTKGELPPSSISK